MENVHLQNLSCSSALQPTSFKGPNDLRFQVVLHISEFHSSESSGTVFADKFITSIQTETAIFSFELETSLVWSKIHLEGKIVLTI